MVMDGHAHYHAHYSMCHSSAHMLLAVADSLRLPTWMDTSHMLLNRLQLTALDALDPFLEDAAHELVEG